MSPARPLRVDVAELLQRPNTRRPFTSLVGLEVGEVAGSRIEPGTDIEVDLTLESLPGGVAVNGTATFAWIGACRRCLEEVRGTAQPEIHEIYEIEPTPDETFPIDGTQIDLEPVVVEAALLALPLAPLCREDCQGPAPDAFPARLSGALEEAEDDGREPGGDPRWAALDDLKFD